MLPLCFCPDGTYELIRLGRDHDGGYLVDPASIAASQSLVSGGISLDWSFERDFCQRNEVPLLAHDGTIGPFHILLLALKYLLLLRIPKSFATARLLVDYFSFFRAGRIHRRLNVGEDSSTSHSLLSILAGNELPTPIFIKMDIEGAEYLLLNDLLARASQISGLVVEFHDIHQHLDELTHFIESFPLTLVHVHSNNFGGKVDANGDPLTLELSFSANPVRVSDEQTIPHPLDQLNFPKQDELPMIFG